MKWPEIKKRYPDKFILIGDIVEEKITDGKSKIIGGTVLEVCDEGKEIRRFYQKYRHNGMNVLYSLPSTPEEFIVEDIPYCF
jgi:hypothetical protein